MFTEEDARSLNYSSDDSITSGVSIIRGGARGSGSQHPLAVHHGNQHATTAFISCSIVCNTLEVRP